MCNRDIHSMTIHVNICDVAWLRVPRACPPCVSPVPVPRACPPCLSPVPVPCACPLCLSPVRVPCACPLYLDRVKLLVGHPARRPDAVQLRLLRRQRRRERGDAAVQRVPLAVGGRQLRHVVAEARRQQRRVVAHGGHLVGEAAATVGARRRPDAVAERREAVELRTQLREGAHPRLGGEEQTG